MVNKLREMDYVFVERTKRTELWRKKGGMHRVPLTTHSYFSHAYVSIVLRQCGLSHEEVDNFIKSVSS